jgi:formylglycine-generating enzyme required for sulfatase activity
MAALLGGCAPGMAALPGTDLRIGRTEVTRGEYARFAAATGRTPDGPCAALVDGPANRWAVDAARTWRSPGFAQTDRHPVVCVNLADAQAYADWLGRRTGRRLRLPTGDEWELAARAGTTGPRWWGEGEPCRFANVSDASRARAHNAGRPDPARFFACDDRFVETAPVGSFRPNPLGLHDMLGNVWEWTLDAADEPGSHVDRGASWTNSPRYVDAGVKHADRVGARTTVLGFRLVEERGVVRRARN